jgi:RNA polymerase sigma-70 factor (ECF subfamily)
MDPLLGKLYDAGRAAWPGIEIDAEVFASQISEPDDSLHAGDLYLACACGLGDAAAIAAFDEKYISQVPSFLARTRATSAQIDEVRQQLRTRLLLSADGKRPKICEYSGRGALGSWLRVVALRVASNLRRGDKQHVELDDDSGPPQAMPQLDPEMALIRNKYGAAFQSAFNDAFVALTPEQRNLFRLHYLDGLNIDRIGVVFSVSRATVGRMMISAREKLMEATLERMQSQLQISPSELTSLLGVVKSQLEVSLRTLLKKES